MSGPKIDKGDSPTFDDGFTLVKSKKGGGKKGTSLRNFHAMHQELQQVEEQCSLENRRVHLKRIDSSVIHVGSSDYFSEFVSTFEEVLLKLKSKLPFGKIICYGLGCFVDCVIARYQLALLICIKNKYNVDKIELYDPMFSSLEKTILTDLKFSVINFNEEGKRKINELTLFYMPHCSNQLANNLLYCNWNMTALEKCVIVSNSFKRVIANSKNLPKSELLRYILQVENLVEEFDIKNTFQYSDIFNDTSIHIFPHDRLGLSSDEIWTIKEEPNYASEEFVSTSR